MRENIKLPATRATAIAAANAVVNHLKLGLFISEFNNLRNSTFRNPELKGNACVYMEGRTNTGAYIVFTGTIIFKRDRSGQFPVEKVVVTYHGPYQGVMTDYECTFGEQIEIRKLKESPQI